MQASCEHVFFRIDLTCKQVANMCFSDSYDGGDDYANGYDGGNDFANDFDGGGGTEDKHDNSGCGGSDSNSK